MTDPASEATESNRARALESGDLVDAGDMAVEAGFTMPVALTAAAFSDCVQWSREDSRRQLVQGDNARLWHVLQMAGQAFLLIQDLSEGILFPVHRVPRDGHSTDVQEVALQAVIETDRGEPAVTIRLWHEA